MNSVGAGSVQMASLARDLYRIGPSGRRRLRVEMERVGQSAASDARSRAGAWSTRIPAAISVRPELRDDRVGVAIRASAAAAPHARPYEGMGQGGSFRHPVFGNREVWVAQATRPYLWPAVAGRRRDVETAAAAAFEAACREAGFR